VKVRGYRIEPGEIEAALLRHSAVREAVVVARDDGEDKRLVACVVPADALDAAPVVDGASSNSDAADKPLVASLRHALAQELPGYMIPSAFVVVNALPRTPSGKVDRHALPRSDVTTQSPYVTPGTPVEDVLAKVWAQLLDVPRVGVYDDFFADLAGHSLLAARLVARVRDLFQMDLALRTLFESPTVVGMAAALLAADAGQGHIERVAQTWLSLERMSDDEVDAMLVAQSAS
jgi:AMP-binding enzyme C-terminal domain/Phosphopantetheine attachment site